MPTYTKRTRNGVKYLTRVTVPKSVHPKGRISRVTKDAATGQAWELAVKAAIKLGKPIPEPEGAVRSVGGGDTGTMAQVLRSAATLHWGQLRKGGTSQVKNANHFVNWVGPKTSPQVALTPAKVREYLEDCIRHGNATPTLNRKISAISVLVRHADVEKFELPWYSMDWSRARKRHFSPENEVKVIELLTRWGHERERDLFIFLNDTGLRPWSEATPATWKQYRQRGGKPFICDVIGKSGLLRDVPLTTRASLAVSRQDRTLEGPWSWANSSTLQGLWDRVIAAIPELGVTDEWAEPTVWYTCRHTFASRLIQAGKSYGNVAQLMDNSEAIIRRVYGHLAPEHKHDEISVLEKFGGQETFLSLVKK